MNPDRRKGPPRRGFLAQAESKAKMSSTKARKKGTKHTADAAVRAYKS